MAEPANGISYRRSRTWYLLCIMVVIGAGLLLRSRFLHLPSGLTKYGGDALWALLVFFICGWAFPRLSTARLAIAALAIACAVEFSQLYHAPLIDRVRATRLGALALGSVFNFPDIPAYALGILMGALTEGAVQRRRETLPR